MRELNWDQMFQRRDGAAHTAVEERVSSFVPWEDLLTLAIVTLVFLSVINSVDSAHWVDNMPSLYPMGFAALLVGYLLARVRLHGLLLCSLALAVGTALVYFQLIAILPGHSVYVRTDNMLDRMHIWWYAVTNDGISSDPLPFIILTLVLLWVGVFVSSWAVFRWKNPWLGLIPGGIALMWNISFLPGQFSYSFVFFVFGAVLLLMRMHLAHREAEWERSGIRYPEFISLSVLNATFWVTLLLLAFAWVIPLANRSDTASERWQDFTAPYTERLAPFARLFVGLNAKKPIEIHNLKDALALRGNLHLSGKEALEVNVKLTPEMAAFLRAQSYDQYTSNGWKVNVDSNVPLSAGDQTSVEPPTAPDARQEVTVHVTVEGGNNGVLFSLGQPQSADTAAEARVGGDDADVSSLQPTGHLKDGDEYSVTGSVNVASIQQLQRAGTGYPSWVTDRYLGLPDDLPERVSGKAREVTAGSANPYDKAASIEQFLRTFPIDYSVPSAPSGQDSVDYFLFDAQRGYFDYHASAMAVMLRTLGIPARVATGYVIDPGQQTAGSTAGSEDFSLSERNAFTWPEVYFPGIGWVEFSPTRSEPLIQRPGSPSARARAGTNSRGTEDLLDLAGIGDGVPTAAAQPAPQTPAAATSDGGSRKIWWWPIPLAVMAALLVTTAGAGKLAWDRGLGELPEPARIWRKTQRLARWSRAGAPETETPREFARRLQRDVGEIEPVAYLADAYERTTFGQHDLSEGEPERMEAAWRLVRNRLFARLIRRH